jgi:CheY-like chemotaxis protein
MNEEKHTILVVDDSEVIRRSLRNFFSDYNFNVVTCSDGYEGIQAAAEYKPSLIFLDLMMPDFDGVKMLHVLKVLEDLKAIPVIIISGNTNRTNVLSVIEAGAERVMSKPLQKEIIIKNINEMLGPDFLLKAKKAKLFSSAEANDIQKKLASIFLKSALVKKEALAEAINIRDRESLVYIIHEFKGAGSTIGYPKLTFISGVIEDHLNGTKINWDQINMMCNQVFSIINEIEEANIVEEK